MIESGSKWKNEGGTVVVHNSSHSFFGVDIVSYKRCGCERIHVSTVDDFIVCYKPCEPLHESKYAYMFDSELHVTPMYLTKQEAKNAGFTEDQRITISTRVRGA